MFFLSQSLVSGGVDSAVCTALLFKALGPSNVTAIHIDTGYMRKGESEQVKESLKSLGIDLTGEWILKHKYCTITIQLCATIVTAVL